MSKLFLCGFLLIVLTPCLGYNIDGTEPSGGLYPKERPKHQECIKMCMTGKCGTVVTKSAYTLSWFSYMSSICPDLCSQHFSDCIAIDTKDTDEIKKAFMANRRKKYKVDSDSVLCYKYCGIVGNRAPKQSEDDCKKDCDGPHTYVT